MDESAINELMAGAWTVRREALSADGAEKDRLLKLTRQQLESVIRSCEQKGEPSLAAQAIHLLANVEHDAGNNDQALELWQKSVAAFRTLDDKAQLAHKLRHLAMICSETGQHAEAREYFDESMALYRRIPGATSQDYANAAGAYAYFLQQREETESASALWEEAKVQYENAGYDDGVTYCEKQLEKLGREG